MPQSAEVRKSYIRQWYITNRDKVLAHQRKYQAANRAHVKKQQRRTYLLRTFGLTEEQFVAMCEEQQYRCAICGIDKPGGSGQWNIDHDHVTGKVRRLLCLVCNVGLGWYERTVDRHDLFRAYLVQFKEVDGMEAFASFSDRDKEEV